MLAVMSRADGETGEATHVAPHMPRRVGEHLAVPRAQGAPRTSPQAPTASGLGARRLRRLAGWLSVLLAERGAPTGAYDFQALAMPGSGRTLRLRPKPPGGTPFFWEADGEYAVGFPPDFQNGNGGVALGYGYDPAGTMTAAICGGTVWVTGEQLRISPDSSIAQRLAESSAVAIAQTKLALNNWLRAAGPAFDASLALEFLGMTGRDVQEGIAAVKERRPPRFRA